MLKVKTKIYRIKADGVWYRTEKEVNEDGYTYFIDIETKEVVHSMPTR
jgi:hypothetical protein